VILEGDSVRERWGVSVVICCHNGAERLPATLEHLRSQVVPDHIQWEVLVIDNASTDATAEVAQRCWPESAPVPLRVIHEARLGLSNARERGFCEAAHPIVSFVDDDNWVCFDWVTRVSTLMSEHPEVGACVGIVEAIFEIPPPSWSTQHSLCSRWPSPEYTKDVTETLGVLMGAGLSVRVAAYRDLLTKGFRHLAIDRHGASLSSGGDYEICLALRLGGWRLWVEPRICVQHFIPRSRLQWEYWRALVRGVASSSVALDPYWYALDARNNRVARFVKRKWAWQTAIVLKNLLQNVLLRPRKALHRRSDELEGDLDILRIEGYIGRLFGLLSQRNVYSSNIRRVLEIQSHHRHGRALNDCGVSRR
jgi:glycosyltransferase involved in cell wall biosynthesis